MRLVFLDSGTLSMIAHPRAIPLNQRCRQWARDLLAEGVAVVIPEIADYEVRRELLRVGATSGLARLDQLRMGFDFAPITSDAMLLAAELWAQARGQGRPTANAEALDGDCILAAQARTAAGTGDEVIVATDNVGHLGLFVDAQPWEQITP